MVTRLLLSVLLCTFLIANSLQSQQAIPIDPVFSSNIMMTAALTGPQLNPPVANEVLGFTGILLNAQRDEISINVSANSAAGQITSAKIFEFDYAAGNDELIFDLTDHIIANKINTTLTDITKENIENMIYGNYYMEIYSSEFPDGAGRGVLKLETDKPFIAFLESDESVSSEAKALASCNYNFGFNAFEINLFASGLSSPITGVYLHSGEEGSSDGEILRDLSDEINGNRLFTTIDITDYFEDVTQNKSYIKIHTEDFPNGELRGQLKLNQNLVFDGWLAGDQVAPTPTNTGINGLCLLVLRGDFRLLDYYVYTDSNEELTEVNINAGALGINGIKTHDITENVDGKICVGTIEFPRPAFSRRLLRGNAYVEIKTENYPDGNTRAQMYRLARDGYLYTFCTNQLNSSDISDGNGVGFLSIDRKLQNAHMFFSVSDLTSPFSDISMYRGNAQNSDSYMVGVTEYLYNSAIEVFWGADNLDRPFTTEDARTIQNSDAFFVVQTENYPEGELRGQIISKLNCTNDFGNSADLELYVAPKRVHYSQYDSMLITYRVCNTGLQTANDIKVDASIPEGFVFCYDNGLETEYNLFENEWTIAQIEPNTCEELELVSLALSDGTNVNYFSQILASGQYDHDSTPGNDQDFTDDEDDEVGFTLIDVENGGSGEGDFDTDLELEMTADDYEVGPYENVNYNIKITNKGIDIATSVLVNITLPPGLAYTSHNVSKGKVSLYSGEWYILEIEPYETIELDLELFTLWPSSTISYFVQIHATNEPDMDSTPGNVFDFVVSEDDEARVDIQTTASMIEDNTLLLSSITNGDVFPNPTSGLLNLNIQSAIQSNGTISIYDATGKVKIKTAAQFEIGFNDFQFDLTDFPIGTYFIRIPELSYATRFLKN